MFGWAVIYIELSPNWEIRIPDDKNAIVFDGN